ncbi:MAG: hypothetical protein IKI94_06820 [Ruminococcus sp.]|nr:hypothetical protein [Ruminococcus sp.]
MRNFSIIVFIVMAVFSVLYFYDFAVFNKRVKATENIVRLRVTNFKNEIVWCILSAVWILLSISRYRTACEWGDKSEAKWNILLIFTWCVTLFLYLFKLIFIRHIYVTENSVIVFSRLKSTCRKENYHYNIINDEDILELYYKKNLVSEKYRIIEDEERLILILKENYEQYRS